MGFILIPYLLHEAGLAWSLAVGGPAVAAILLARYGLRTEDDFSWDHEAW